MDRDPSKYPPDDGHNHAAFYIYFRGGVRLASTLTADELLCALADAHNDLDVLAIRHLRRMSTDPESESLYTLCRRHALSGEEENEARNAESGG